MARHHFVFVLNASHIWYVRRLRRPCPKGRSPKKPPFPFFECANSPLPNQKFKERFLRGCLASGEAGGERVGTDSNRAIRYKVTTRAERATSVLLEKGSRKG